MTQSPVVGADASHIHVAMSKSSQSAPAYIVPLQPIVSVEHPFIIKNLSNGMKKLGTSMDVANLVDPREPDPKACLFLRPEDRTTRPIWSSNVKTGNVVIRVTLPKRTGRRRKRGSSDDFEYPTKRPNELDDPIATIDSRNTARLFRGLSDNANKYKIEPVGLIHQTHRFRNLPDFVWSTSESPFMERVRKQLLPMTLEGVKSFKFDMSRGPKVNTDLPPPPSLSHMSVPFNYSYKQNPATKLTLDKQGRFDTVNTQAPPRLRTIIVPYDIKDVPKVPSTEMTPYETLDDKLRGLVDLVRALFDEQPLWTRRAVKNRIHQEHFILIGKYAYQYIGYMFSSGPWRDAVVKYGVDPRTDCKYRIYQTLVFKMKLDDAPRKAQRAGLQGYNVSSRGGARDAIKVPERSSHLFDGKSVSKEGRTWQVCDVADLPLKKILATKNLRSKCDIYADGWYHNGTWAIVRAIMRVKIDRLLAGQGELPEFEIAPILAFPEIIDSTTKHLAMLPNIPRKPSGTDKFRLELAALVRTIANTPETESTESRKSKQPPDKRFNVELEDDMEGIDEDDEDDEDEVVDPRLRDMVKGVNKLENAAKELGSLNLGNEEGEDNDEDELGIVLEEGKEGAEGDEDTESSGLGEGDDEDGIEDGDGAGDERNWRHADEDEEMDEDGDSAEDADEVMA